MKLIISILIVFIIIILLVIILALREIGKAEDEFEEYQREYEK